jgi:hypothetical protein
MKQIRCFGWLRRARPAPAVLIVTATLVSVATACGGGSSPARAAGSLSVGSSLNSQQLTFSQCMRSHGVSRFPDPNSGGIPKEDAQQLGVTESQYQAAYNACQHLLPNGGSGPNQAQIELVRQQSLQFSQCVRSHGVNLPDPDSSGRIPDPASVGIDQGSPQFEAANQACGQFRPPYLPSNEAYNAWAQTRGS